jgi:hypothetical protein
VLEASAGARASSAPRTALAHHPQRDTADAAALHPYTKRPSPDLSPVLSPRVLQQRESAFHFAPLTPSIRYGFGFVQTLPLVLVSVLVSCLLHRMADFAFHICWKIPQLSLSPSNSCVRLERRDCQQSMIRLPPCSAYNTKMAQPNPPPSTDPLHT